jgi:hypothetical protein
VHRLIPFAIRLVDRNVSESDAPNTETGEVTVTARGLGLFELTHRGGKLAETHPGDFLSTEDSSRRRRMREESCLTAARYPSPAFRPGRDSAKRMKK